MFDSLFSPLKGTYDGVSDFFDKSQEVLDFLPDTDSEGDVGIIEDLAKAAASTFNSTDSSDTIVESEGMSLPGSNIKAGDTEASRSVNMKAIEQEWLLRLREFSKIDEV